MIISRPASRKSLHLIAVVLTMLVPISTYAADLKLNPKMQPGLPTGTPRSGADAVGSLMNPAWRTSSTPLASPNLVDKSEPTATVQGPQIYGRAEQGGQNGSVLEGLLG
jgi:hypothetical protein